jgi:predicted transcriptional regulator
MDIKNLMQQMHDTQSEAEKNRIGEEIKSRFSLLSDSEKKEVQKNFMEGWDAKLKEADALIEKIDIALEIEEISKYISLSKIASNYFGKSKEWLYQRIKGYAINGKSAAFTEEERKKLTSALEDISQLAHKTSLKIA